MFMSGVRCISLVSGKKHKCTKSSNSTIIEDAHELPPPKYQRLYPFHLDRDAQHGSAASPN